MKFHLEPIDWLLNPWHPHKPWPKLEPREFSYRDRKTWPMADTGREEAIAMWNIRLDRPPQTPLEDFSQTLRLAEGASFETPESMTLIAKMYSIEHLAEWIQAVPVRPGSEGCYDDSFRYCILPYLSASERSVLCDAIQRQARNNRTPNSPSLILAGLLGAPPEIAAYLDSQTLAAWIPQSLRFALLGLPTPKVHQHHALVVKGTYTDPIIGLIAHTGLDYLAAIVGSIQATGVKQLVEIVRDPAAAPVLMPLLDLPKLAPPVRGWFQRYGVEAAEALANHPWKTTGAKARKQREAAMVLAESLRKRGGTKQPGDTKPYVGFNFGVFKKSPAWVDTAVLPPIELREPEAYLDDKSTRDLLALIAATPPLEIPAAVAELKRNATPESLDRWALELMEVWRQGGMKPKERWALASVGIFGGPVSTGRLRAHLASWAAGGRYDTARLGYQCLLKAGAVWDVCEPALRGLSFATEAAEAEAADRAMSLDELAEMSMPSLGFSRRGERDFQLGSQKLRLKAAQELRIFDEAGKMLRSLPKLRQGDDSAAYNQAVSDFRTLKLEYDRTVRREIKRFEKAAFNGRRYTREHFEAYVLPHPVMGALARMLVWGAFDDGQRRLVAFRVDEADGYSGVENDTIAFPESAMYLRVLHAFDLTEGERTRWRQLLAEYDIVQPFPQLNPEQRAPKETTFFRSSNSNHHPATMMLAAAHGAGCYPSPADLSKMMNWQMVTRNLACCSAGFVRDPMQRNTMEEHLDTRLFQKVADNLRQCNVGGCTVKLHYLHMERWGLGWLLQIDDPQGKALHLHEVERSILDILAGDFEQLGLRGA